MLAGVSVDYYVRMERGSLAGASESVLEALADALRLDEAERAHLFALARESGTRSTRTKRTAPASVRPAIQQELDAQREWRSCAGRSAATSTGQVSRARCRGRRRRGAGCVRA